MGATVGYQMDLSVYTSISDARRTYREFSLTSSYSRSTIGRGALAVDYRERNEPFKWIDQIYH